jgi:hypothetical protein
MKRFFPALCASALTVAGMTAEALAESGSPILVADCRGGLANVQLREIAAFDLTFRNVSKKKIDEFRVAIVRRGTTIATFDVRGSFLPQKDMKKALRKSVGQGSAAYESASNTCNVLHVHFADGKTWDRPG